jgi:hypothetical protein
VGSARAFGSPPGPDLPRSKRAIRSRKLDDFLQFAQRILDIVEAAWIEHSEAEGGIEHGDENDRQLILGYVHAFRRFRAIKRLAEDERPSPEAVMVPTRSLVSLTHRTLYLVASDDPDEREERLQRFLLLSAHEQRKHFEAIIDEVPSLAPWLEQTREAIRLREELFTEKGWSLGKPIFPSDEQVAKELGLNAHYAEVYRSGTAHMHYTAISAAGGFAIIEEGTPPSVALYGYDLNELRQAMISATVVYADFLIAAERVVKLGVGPRIEELRPAFAKVVARAKAELGSEGL